jgi:hypothetical protein
MKRFESSLLHDKGVLALHQHHSKELELKERKNEKDLDENYFDLD